MRGGRLFLFTLAFSALPVVASAEDKSDKMRCIHAAEEAQQLRAGKKLREARERLEACSKEACPTLVRRDCRNWRSEVDAQLPTLVVRARDDKGVDVTDVTVKVDGVVVAERLDGNETPVDPGEHVIEVERSGAPPQKQQVLAVAGEKNRAVAFVFKSPEAPVATPTPAATPAVVLATPTPPPEEKHASKLVPWVVLGVGGAATIAGGVLGITSYTSYESLKSSCAPNCDQGEVDGLKTRALVGDVMMGAGIVTMGIATFMLLSSSSSPAKARGALPTLPLAGTF
jgi:hypothetical protein